MLFLHRHPTAPLADILHDSKLVFAYVFGINLWFATETAIGFVTTGVAQMTGRIGNSAAIFACISHCSLLIGIAECLFLKLSQYEFPVKESQVPVAPDRSFGVEHNQ